MHIVINMYRISHIAQYILNMHKINYFLLYILANIIISGDWKSAKWGIK